MAEYTPNLALKKPSNSDYVRISDNNENMDVLDADIKALQDAIEELEPVEIINDLNHTDADKALSANQGKVLDDKISTLTGRITNGEKTVAYEAKRLDNLIKLTQGKVFDYQTDATEAYTKSIPSGSQEYGALNMVGGKSFVYNIISAKAFYSVASSTSADFKGEGYGITQEGYAKVVAANDLNVTSGSKAIYVNQERPRLKYIANHVYYVILEFDTNFQNVGDRLYIYDKANGFDGFSSQYARADAAAGRCEYKTTPTIDGDSKTIRVYLYGNNKNNNAITATAGDYFTFKSYTIIDLTKMFGENIPSDAVLKEVFSKNYYEPINELMNFGVNAVESVGSDALDPNVRKETFAIPQAIQALPDYGASAGSAYNYIDFERKVYVQNVGSVDLGTLTWTVDATSAYTVGIQDTVKKDTANFKSIKYVFGTNNGRGNLLEGQCGLNGHASGVFCVKDSNYTTASELKLALNGVMLNYELATPIETDISQHIDNGLIFAEGNGTITFKNIHGNDYHIPVPNKETYMVKLADAI